MKDYKIPILTFFSDGYQGKAIAYDYETNLYILKNDEKLIKLITIEEMNKFIKILNNLNN